MVRGFYALGAGMLTQNRILTSVSNNLSNIETPGYKKKEMSTTTFGKMLINRVDTKKTPIGNMYMITVADKMNTIHSQGILKNTERTLDFAIKGEGFYAIQGENATVYTRNGSFNVDQDGYLVLSEEGRVMGNDGPIHVGTDNFTSDSQGNLSVDGQVVDKIAVYNFEDYNNLQTVGNGMFASTGGAPTQVQQPKIMWKTIEGSNVDAAKEMTNAIALQRNLQSCSQMIKMYDKVLDKAVNDIARV